MGFFDRVRDSFESVKESVTSWFSREDGDDGLEETEVRQEGTATDWDYERQAAEDAQVTDFDAYELESSVDELEFALELIETWGGDFEDVRNLAELGLPLDELEFLTMLESPPIDAKLRYEFPFFADAAAWVVDVGAYGYFAVSPYSGGYAVWEMDG